MTILIEAPNRIHITLLAMDTPIYRVNGGIGFAVDGKNLKMLVSRSTGFSIIDRRNSGLTVDDRQRLIAKLQRLQSSLGISNAISAEILEGPPLHQGLGSGSSATLAAIEGYLIISGIELPSSEIVRYSQRGGTSGIGVSADFNGGFYFDSGQLYVGQKHTSSHYNEGKSSQSLVLSRFDMPSWTFALFLPSNLSAISGIDEGNFFDSVCPITHEQASSALYHSVFGVLSAVAESDLETFCRSINNLQSSRWKSAEIDRYGGGMKSLILELQKSFCGVGMSSLGPTLYCATSDNAYNPTNVLGAENPGEWLVVTPNNKGRRIVNA